MIHIRYRHLKTIGCLIGVTAIIGACTKFLDIAPPETDANAQNVYASDGQAAGVLTGVYGRMSGNVTGFCSGRNSITLYTGLSGDELQAYAASGATYNLIYANAVSMDIPATWTELYQQIYVCNAAILGITASAGLTPSIKDQLLGEALFMRAFLHFYLVNLWGQVPLVTTTDYRVNQAVARQPVPVVYQQILADLTDAKVLLSDDFLSPAGAVTTERVRPNKAAAIAMLARVYLYLGEWEKAESNATEVINNTRYHLVAPINDIFLKNSQEAIWQLPPVTSGINTYDGNTFIRTVAPGGTEPVGLARSLVDAFGTNDQRKTNWVDSVTLASIKYYWPKKYRIKTVPPGTPAAEYLMVLRLAEQYLIRAEARAKQGKLLGEGSAAADINSIRTRAGLGSTPALTQQDLLLAIEQERKIELCTEWGHRWFDMKRTGRIDAVMSGVATLKGTQWDTDRQLYPIPREELVKNSYLQPQNPGYN